ncbi:MAG: phytoene/squalene synthase family protein [Sphingomonadaceae bacterium]
MTAADVPVIRPALVEHARQSIAKGSKSFAAASRLFDKETRERVWLLYAWCRACDDLADAQDHGHAMGEQAGADKRVAMLEMLTAQALSDKLTGKPEFDALYVLKHETGITQAMADDVTAGFALDAAGWRPLHEADMLRYCYHVAGAVGVMMAVVMGVDPADEDTLDRACDLGIGFQLANIARDVWEDDAAGRCYLPMEWLAEADIPPGEVTKPHYREALVPLVARLCEMQKDYEASARVGAARLTFRQRWAVLSAAGIYGAIARKVEKAGAHAWDHRVHTGKAEKLWHVIAAFVRASVSPRQAPSPAWSRRELAALAREDATTQPSP